MNQTGSRVNVAPGIGMLGMWVAVAVLVGGCASEPGVPYSPASPVVASPGLLPTPGAPFDPPPGPEPEPLAGAIGMDQIPPVQPDVVARVNGKPIVKTELAEFLCLARPVLARILLDNLVKLRILREERKRLNVTISEEQVESRVQIMEDELRKNARDRNTTVAEYIQAEQGIPLDVFRAMQPIHARFQLVQERVVRYSQILDDCVTGRIIVVEDQAEAERLVEQLRAGADFSTVARRSSVHYATSHAGGLLPPVGRWGVQPELEKVFFGMDPGAISDPLPLDERGKKMWVILKCLGHQPARKVAYLEVRDEIEKGLKDRPFRDLELAGWQETVTRRYNPEILLRPPESAWISGRAP